VAPTRLHFGQEIGASVQLVMITSQSRQRDVARSPTRRAGV
jgi:hypothetical protein